MLGIHTKMKLANKNHGMNEQRRKMCIFYGYLRIMNYIRKHFYTNNLQSSCWKESTYYSVWLSNFHTYTNEEKKSNKHLSQNFIKNAIGFDCWVHLFDFEIQIKRFNLTIESI